jgi:hypothetical protein
MNIAPGKTEYTPEDLLTMPDGDRYELVNGVLVERHRSVESRPHSPPLPEGAATNTAPGKTEYSPEDLLTMPDGDRYELVNGVLVERHMGWLAGWIAGELFRLVGAFCDENRLGWAVPGGDAGYQGFPD